MENLPPSTRAPQGSAVSLAVVLSLYAPYRMFNSYPSNNEHTILVCLTRKSSLSGTRRAGRQWETVRLSWRATGSRGDSWFVRSRLSSTTLGFPRPTLRHIARPSRFPPRRPPPPARPLCARTRRRRPKCCSRAIRVLWGYEKLRPQLRLRTREPPPLPALLLRSIPAWSRYNSSLVASLSAEQAVRLSDLDQPRTVSTAYTNGIAIAIQSAADTNQHRAATSKSEGGHRSSQL